MVVVAQLVRASVCGTEGRGFESRHPPQVIIFIFPMKKAAPIQFETRLYTIKDWTILQLPADASAKLPSRGMVMVKGTLNDIPFITLLEPDGHYGEGKKPSHWFRPDEKLLKDAHVTSGDTVSVTMEATKEWVEPEVPEDVKKALFTSPKAKALWDDVTPLAHWDWVRWVRAVKTADTRQKHLEVMLDKLNKGMRRPCCFNRNMCSEPYVSKNWHLLEPTT